MGKLFWYLNRLQAMDLREVCWRVQQRLLAKAEKKRFGKQRVRVDGEVWNEALRELGFDAGALGINLANAHYSTVTEVHRLQGPDYGKWPDTFSYDLTYKQRDDLGDARTCWEKHRHFRFALLAKAAYVSGDRRLLAHLSDEQDRWCEQHTFLHGIAWTSVMEVAIRAVNWMVALAFCKDKKLAERLRTGVINMTDYLTRHYSRFSSANNHLLVEAAAIGLAGYAFGYRPWKELGMALLSKELLNQNYEDGVNKELSLHYQTFGMEAYCLMMRAMQAHDDKIPTAWYGMLSKQAEYVAHSLWNEQVPMEFGDDDEGKILDLQGGEWNYCSYILQFCSLLTGRRYHAFGSIHENIFWLFSNKAIEQIRSAVLYDNRASRCFEVGGNTFLRDTSGRILVGMDHAALGFGRIAAHGHADALSVQLMVDGMSVLADPGTYIYHCDLGMRNVFRKTINHNTLCLLNRAGKTIDQSQMLGPFLWGKRAQCMLEVCESDRWHDKIVASHNGYHPIVHMRTVELKGKNSSSPWLQIEDELDKDGKWVVTWLLGKQCKASGMENGYRISCGQSEVIMTIGTSVEKICLEEAWISESYGTKTRTTAIRIYGSGMRLSVNFKINLYH